MRRTLWLFLGFALLLGAVLGATLEFVRSRAGPSALDASDAELRATPSGELGSRLMAAIGRRFVASRVSYGNVTLFDQPKPYGHWLCRVNAYFVPRKVVTGVIDQPQDRWSDDLSVETRYGIWRRPSIPDPPEGARIEACARFRAFDNMFRTEGESADPERAAYLLEKIIMAARAKRPIPFPLTCRVVSKEDLEGRSCDGRSLLRALSLERLGSTENLSFKYGEDFGSSQDALDFAVESPGTHSFVRVTVRSRQIRGGRNVSERAVESVAVLQDNSH